MKHNCKENNNVIIFIFNFQKILFTQCRRDGGATSLFMNGSFDPNF